MPKLKRLHSPKSKLRSCARATSSISATEHFTPTPAASSGDTASLSGAALLALIDFADAGWDDAHLALTQMITEYLHRGEKMPPFLATYAARVLNRRAPGPVGPKPATHFVADLVICMLMAELITRFSLKPTRYSKRRPSAASITAQALAEAGLHRGTEAAIEKVWKRWGVRILDNWPETGMVSPS
jgi:hypothetical protein